MYITLKDRNFSLSAAPLGVEVQSVEAFVASQTTLGGVCIKSYTPGETLLDIEEGSPGCDANLFYRAVWG